MSIHATNLSFLKELADEKEKRNGRKDTTDL
jgi:hypothetical protein